MICALQLRGDEDLNIQCGQQSCCHCTYFTTGPVWHPCTLARGALLHEQGWHFGSVLIKGQLQSLQKDDLNKELPTTGMWSTIHHVTSPLKRIRRVGWSVCIVHATTRRHLWGDDVSLWNHGPTVWAQIDRVTYEPSVCLPVFLSVVSVPVRCLSLHSNPEWPNLVFFESIPLSPFRHP